MRQFEISDSAALGAALRSSKSYYDSINIKKNWHEIVTLLNIEDGDVIEPDDNYKSLYDDMLIVYKKCEDYILKNGKDPEPFRKQFIQKYFQI